MTTRIVLGVIIAAALVAAWWIRWGCDDAYISYVYARDLVYGDGLTWFGEHIEGYTNFLWVLWVAGGLVVGVDPLVWSWIGSLTAMAVVLVLVYRVVVVRRGSTVAALAAAAILAVNYTFIAFGTSGLETMLQCALLTGAYLEVERLQRDGLSGERRLARLSIVASLALWTRLDSAVVLGVLAVVVLRQLLRDKASRRQWLAVLAPAVILVGGWLAWKLVYYGDILPNTFHAKVDVTKLSLKYSAKFVGQFLYTYALGGALVAVAVVSAWRRAFTPRLPALIVGMWFSYIVGVGGDFMEFRFFVPVLPLLAVVIAEAAVEASIVRAIILTGVLLGFSIHHARTFTGSEDSFFDSVEGLATFYGKVDDNDWSTLGTPIGDVLADTGATLACNGAGAIPYYADLPTVDQLGLNDRWVARHGAKPTTWSRPGHQRFATHAYLRERKVTFVIGSPVLIGPGALTNYRLAPGVKYWVERVLGPSPIEGNSIIAVAAPIDPDSSLLMWYLTPSPEVDARIQAAGWEIKELRKN